MKIKNIPVVDIVYQEKDLQKSFRNYLEYFYDYRMNQYAYFELNIKDLGYDVEELEGGGYDDDSSVKDDILNIIKHMKESYAEEIILLFWW